MKRLETTLRSRLALTALTGLLALPGAAAAQGSLVNCANHIGTIATPDETDAGTFVATARDSIC
jgi:hypothetical protein